MAVKERDVVLTGKDSTGNPTIDLPITRLGNIEAGSKDKTTLADADALPVLDSTNNMEMKKISWANVIATVKQKFEDVFAAASHKHSATEITSDTLGVPRGGTGKSDFTTGNYLLGNGADAVAEKTPSQVLADIGAVPTSRKVNGKALSGDVSLEAKDVGAAVPSVTVTFTLSVAAWSGSTAPFTQTVTVSGVTASSNGSVGLANAATDAQWDAAVKAQIRKTVQGANSLTFKAYGSKPTVNLPCAVTLIG